MQIFAEAGSYRPPSGDEPNDWIVNLTTGDLSLGTYSIPAGGVDDQQPHTEDEIYVVKTGRATVVAASGTAVVGPGSVIYVPAGEEHRFTDVTEDLALIVVFAPPYGSRSLPGLDHARRFLDAAPRQRVGALVTGIARVPLHPHPADVVRTHRLDQPAPQVVVLDRLLGRGLPAVALPVRDPLGDPVEQVLAVGVQDHRGRPLQRLQRLDGRRQLHPVVRGQRLGTVHLLFGALPAHHHAPAARSRVPAARAVCVDHDLGHAGRLRPAAAVSATPPAASRRFALVARSSYSKGTPTRGGAVR